MFCEKFLSLDNVMAPAADHSGANDSDDLGEEIVVLLQGTRIGAVGLKFRVRGEEARDVKRAEKVAVEDVLGARADLGEFQKQCKPGVLVMLLIRVA